MSAGRFPLALGCRVNESQQAKVDAAARLKGLTRAEFVKRAALERATADLRAAVQGDGEEAS